MIRFGDLNLILFCPSWDVS